MNNKKSNNSIASEIISDREKDIEQLNTAINRINIDISKIRSIFRAVHHSMEIGFLTKPEADAAMSGIQNMLDVLEDNMIDMLGTRKSISIKK